jgi:opacity protein-like surface antigen
MKKILFVSVITLLFAVSFNSYAADGWYMSGNLGLVSPSDSSLGSFDEAELEAIIEEDLPAGTSGSLEFGYDMGFSVSAAVGYDFGNNYRLEAELAYLTYDIDELSATVTIPGTGSASESMDAGLDGSNLALMFNGYYDFMEGSALRPYITAGIGYAKVDLDIDDDTVMAYQVGLGLSYEMSETLCWDFRYRHFATSDAEVPGPFDEIIDVENSSHNVTVGMRYSF